MIGGGIALSLLTYGLSHLAESLNGAACIDFAQIA